MLLGVVRGRDACTIKLRNVLQNEVVTFREKMTCTKVTE